MTSAPCPCRGAVAVCVRCADLAVIERLRKARAMLGPFVPPGATVYVYGDEEDSPEEPTRA